MPSSHRRPVKADARRRLAGLRSIRKRVRSRSGGGAVAASELQRETAGDRLAVGLDVAEGEFGVEPVFELGDPALGPIHPSGDVLLGKSCAQALADEVRDDFGP